jgi:hypothetical protein
MTPKAPNSPGTLASLRGLGVCWIIYGVLRIGLAVWLAAFTPTATVMFGALLVRVADPYSLMAAFHVFYLFAILLSALSGVFGLVAGFALLSARRRAPALAVVAAFLSLSELPIGITLGVYTLLRLRPLHLAEPSGHALESLEAHPWPAR